MIKAVRHVGIVVHNMDKSVVFWRDIMGLSIVADFWEEGEFIDELENLKDVRLHMIKLSAPGGVLIELLKDDSHPNERNGENNLCDIGIRHIAFTVENVDISYNILNEYGCKMLSSPLISPDRKAKVFFARDPEGNLLELVEIINN